jgi:adenylosuccinate synthase
MAGIDPTRCSVTITNWVVCRVFPIRVAGNSGPMKNERTWEELGLPLERTTVTQKVRRVGDWDLDLVKRAVQANGGHQAKVVITMLDQIIPELATMPHDPESGTSPDEEPALQKATEWIQANASRELIGAEVAAITFGPTKILFTPAAERDLGPTEDAVKAALAQMFGGELGIEPEDGR